MKYKVFIIEDDVLIRDLLKEYVGKYSFEVKAVDDFEDIIKSFDEFNPQVVLMDINLPKLDGFYWCRKIRQKSNIPIIFISARNSGMDQVMALESGADDYITKPFDVDVVIAKIKSQIRRAFGDYAPKIEKKKVAVDKLRFYPECLQVEFENNSIILTKREGILLEYIMMRYPKVVSRDFLLEKIWDDKYFVEENTLNVNISRVRSKLEDLGVENSIETIRGVGYRLKKTW